MAHGTRVAASQQPEGGVGSMDEARAGGTQPDAGAEQKNVPGSTAAVQHYCLLHSLL